MIRPVFDRLPDKGYQDNPIVGYVTEYYDSKLLAVAGTMGTLWERLVLLDRNDDSPSVDSYAVEPLSAPVVAGYPLTVTQDTVFTLRVKYPIVEQGRSHSIRIVEATRGTVWDRQVSAKGYHYYTNILLKPGTYSVTTTYALGLPLAASVTTPAGGGYTIGESARIYEDAGEGYAERTGLCIPLVMSKQTETEQLRSATLDYTAYLLGMTGKYWLKSWDDGTKENLIKSSNLIQQWRGTLKGLRAVLDAHDVPYDIYGGSSAIRLSFAVYSGIGDNPPTQFGQVRPDVFVRLPLTSQRGSREYTEASRAVANYTAASSNVRTCYQAFHLGFSVVGDPVFF